MCSMTEKVGKRVRKANFSAEEVRVLLEELQMEHVTLFSSHSATLTNEMKKEVWKRITSKVNACGVAVRTSTELKEKWRALKGSVLNKKRDEAKTGGGPAPASVPYEEVILSIIGDKSNLFSGVTGEDDNSTAGFDTFGEPSNVFQDTLHSDADPGCSHWSDKAGDNPSSSTPSPAVAENPVSFIQVEREDGGRILVPLTTPSQHTPADMLPGTPVTTKKKRKMSVKPAMFNTDNPELVDEWLRCQIEESKVKKRYYELKTRKIQLELEKLEKRQDN